LPPRGGGRLNPATWSLARLRMPTAGEELPFRMTPPNLEVEQYELLRVAGPANGVVVMGSLGLILNLGILVLSITLYRPETTRPAGKRDRISASAERGEAAAPLLEMCAIGIPTLLIYPLAIVGGLRMRELRSYRIAFASSILVMLPCSVTFVFGIPVGMWAYAALADPCVKGAFR
jgi:hypothetical protein